MRPALGQLAVALSTLAACWLYDGASAEARAANRFELLACALDALGAPLPWAAASALTTFPLPRTPNGRMGTYEWAAESLGNGLYLPMDACGGLLRGTATSDREAAQNAFSCAAGISYSVLAFSHIWRGGWYHPYRLYGGLDDAIWLAWGALAFASGYHAEHCARLVISRSLRLWALLSLPEAQVEQFGYLLGVQIDLVFDSLLRVPSTAARLENGAASAAELAMGEKIEAYWPDEQRWWSGHVTGHRRSGVWWRQRQHRVEYDHGPTRWESLVSSRSGTACTAWRRHDAMQTPAGVRVPLAAYAGLAALFICLLHLFHYELHDADEECARSRQVHTHRSS